MRKLAFAAVVTIAALPAHGQQTEIEDVISGQIAALMADDFTGAFDYASPMIQGLFGTAENFGEMVRNGYPMVHRPDSVQYLELDDMGMIKRQRVLIGDRAGAFHTLEYEMIEGPNGWKINGVRILDTPRIGV